MMSIYKILQQFFLQSFLFFLLLFIIFYKIENGNINTVIFGVFLYLPYVFILVGLNLFFINIGLKVIHKKPYIFLTAVFTNIVLIIWFLLSNEPIEIKYWKFTLQEFVIFNIIITILNTLTLKFSIKN